MLTYKWRRRGQEVIFSWSVSSPFVILHVDFCLPGNFTDSSGNVSLMNVKCEMTQFVIVVPDPNEKNLLSLKLLCSMFFSNSVYVILLF